MEEKDTKLNEMRIAAPSEAWTFEELMSGLEEFVRKIAAHSKTPEEISWGFAYLHGCVIYLTRSVFRMDPQKSMELGSKLDRLFRANCQALKDEPVFDITNTPSFSPPVFSFEIKNEMPS